MRRGAICQRVRCHSPTASPPCVRFPLWHLNRIWPTSCADFGHPDRQITPSYRQSWLGCYRRKPYLKSIQVVACALSLDAHCPAEIVKLSTELIRRHRAFPIPPARISIAVADVSNLQLVTVT